LHRRLPPSFFSHPHPRRFLRFLPSRSTSLTFVEIESIFSSSFFAGCFDFSNSNCYLAYFQLSGRGVSHFLFFFLGFNERFMCERPRSHPLPFYSYLPCRVFPHRLPRIILVFSSSFAFPPQNARPSCPSLFLCFCTPHADSPLLRRSFFPFVSSCVPSPVYYLLSNPSAAFLRFIVVALLVLFSSPLFLPKVVDDQPLPA